MVVTPRHTLYARDVPFQVLSKKRLHDLVEEVDPTQLIDEDVEEVSMILCVECITC